MAKAQNLSFEIGTCLLMTGGFIEVAQQSKARNKNEFLSAFAPVIAEATATAYRGATNDVQNKLRRVVDVWRQRNVFELPIQEAIETRIDGMHSILLKDRAIWSIYHLCWELLRIVDLNFTRALSAS